MAVLFNTFEDFKPFIGSANINFDISTLESYINDAIEKNLVPYLGQAQVNDIVSKYETNSTNSQYLAILPKVRSVITQFALLYWSLDSKLNISDAGLSRKESDSSKSAYQWQSEEFKNARNDSGWQRLYNLIIFLEANIADYSLYAASSERTWLTGRMVWKLSDFAKVRSIENFQTIIKLLPYLTAAEEDMIKEGITSDVYTELKNNPTTAVNAKAYRFCLGAIVNMALYKASMDFPFRISANGIYIDTLDKGEQNYRKSSQNIPDVEKLKADCLAAKDIAYHSLIEYLNANCSATVFESYFNEKYSVAVAAEKTLAETRARLKEGKTPIL